MPTSPSESLTRMWTSSESIPGGGGSSGSSGFHSPGSVQSLSPCSTSPDNTLHRKRRLRRVSSAGTVLRDEIIITPGSAAATCTAPSATSTTTQFVIQSDCRDASRSQSPALSIDDAPGRSEQVESPLADKLALIIGWYPYFLLKMVRVILITLLPRTWKQIILAVPMFWLSVWFWCFWQVIQLPLTMFKMLLSVLLTPVSERHRPKRTVLISGGSTIQALHLARNFYSTGARVVVCEVDGLFALTRFSTAVSKFYTVPKPTSDQQQNYVRALCDIVSKEDVQYFVPVSATTAAYYDAVAKPHLELLGCSVFCPGIKEVWALDDTLEVLRRCQKASIPTPIYYAITSQQDLMRLYDTGVVRTGAKLMMSTSGPSGLRARAKLILPALRSELKVPQDISEHKPWVVVQDVVDGEHYITCTTVKESRVIANVTCRLDATSNGLVPVEQKEVTAWLHHFFASLQLLRPITGHISFRFAIDRDGGRIVPLSSRVGVTLPYICYTSVQPKLIWKPCRHFSRQNSGALVAEHGRHYLPETVFDFLAHPSVDAAGKFVGTVLDKREALFAIWDPIPYCAYYHMQLPFRNVVGFLQRRQEQFPCTVTAPVH